MKPTHKIYLSTKKTGRETLPLAIPQVEGLSEFFEKRISTDIHGLLVVHNGRL